MLRQLAQALLNRRVTLLSASAAFAGMHSNQSPTLKACSPLVAPGSVPAPTKPGYTTTLTHIFVPEETNPSGNVHGGSILKHIEQAGWLAAARHCASSGTFPRAGGSVVRNFDAVSRCGVAAARMRHRAIGAHRFLGTRFYGECCRVSSQVVCLLWRRCPGSALISILCAESRLPPSVPCVFTLMYGRRML